MKTAILISGHVNCGLSHKDHIYGFYKKNPNIDIFIHSYDCLEKNEIIDFYKPKEYIFDLDDTSKNLDLNLLSLCESKKQPETRASNVLNMWRKRQLCFNMIDKSYDIIFLTRFDCYSLKYIFDYYEDDKLIIPHGGNFRNGILDLCCLGNYNNLFYYCSLYDKIKDYIHEIPYFHPEFLLNYHLSKNPSINIKRVPTTMYLKHQLLEP